MSVSGLPPARDSWQRALYLPLTILAWLAVAIVVLWLLGHVTHTVVLIILAAVLSFALSPLVMLLRRWFSRPFAIAAAYLLGLVMVVGLGLLLVVTATQQVINLVASLPDYVQQMQQLQPQILAALGPFGVTAASLQSLYKEATTGAQATLAVLAAGSLGMAQSIIGDLLDAVLILMLSVYFTLSGSRVARWLQSGVPENMRTPGRFLVRTVNQVVGGYVRGTLSMALLIGALVGLGLGLLGAPYPVLLGVLAFFMEFVPVIGVLISGLVSLIIMLPHGMGSVIAVLVYFILVHLIESDIVGPRVMGKAVGIHPATGIIAFAAGSELFGAWGALFAAPIAGLLQAVAIALWSGYAEHRAGLFGSAVDKRDGIMEEAQKIENESGVVK